MASDETISPSFSTPQSELLNYESGFLYGVGNEVWAGLIISIIFICLFKYFLDVYIFPPEATTNSDGTATTNNPGRVRPSGQNHDCSICLGSASYAIETNCGHIFCGDCIFQYYEITPRSEGPLSTPTCPYCRQRMTVLLPFFSDVERNAADLDAATIESRQKLYQNIRSYNRLFSGEPRSFVEHIADLPMLLRHLWRYFWSGEGIHILFRLRILMFLGMAVFYVLLPFDLIPEVVFGIFGLLDDIIVFVLILMYVVVVFRNVISQTGMGAEHN